MDPRLKGQVRLCLLRGERDLRVGREVPLSTRRQENKVSRYEFNEDTKIRDVKFNPHRAELLAVQSSNKL